MKTKIVAALALIVLGLWAVRLYFARVSAQSMQALQTFALSVLRTGRPDWRLERSGKNGILLQRHGAVGRIYLDNILREAGSDRGRAKELIEQSVRTLSEQPEMNDASASLPSLDAVKSRLRPILVPRGYAAQFELAARPFAGDIAETLVIDDHASTRYVRSQDLKAWLTEFEPLRQLAEAALWRDSQTVKLEPTPAGESKPGKFVVLATRDGYDAARLAVREMRAALAAELGSPFYVAVPNRDFLVAWSTDYAFAEQFAEKARSDFEQRGYPLSPLVYRVEADQIEAVR